MAYADQSMSGNKVVAIIIVGLIHLLVGYALVTGLAYSAVQKAIERVTTIDIEEPEPEEEPPPPPPEEVPATPPIVVPPAPMNLSPAPSQMVTIPDPPERIIPVQQVVQPRAPEPAPPPKVNRSKSVSPKNQSRWASRIQENYPSRAVRSGTEGTVGVAVSIGPDGKVSACSVSSSSGSDVLDSAACDGMRRYAQFDPALDEDGRPTTASWSTRIVYKLD